MAAQYGVADEQIADASQVFDLNDKMKQRYQEQTQFYDIIKQVREDMVLSNHSAKPQDAQDPALYAAIPHISSGNGLKI